MHGDAPICRLSSRGLLTRAEGRADPCKRGRKKIVPLNSQMPPLIEGLLAAMNRPRDRAETEADRPRGRGREQTLHTLCKGDLFSLVAFTDRTPEHDQRIVFTCSWA